MLTIIGLGLAAFFVWQRDFFTAAFFVLIYVIILFFAGMKPKTITIKITSQGIHLGSTPVPYSELKKFWIVYDGDVKTLNFENKAYLNRYMTIQLVDQNPLHVQEFLRDYLPEDLEQREQMSDKIARRLRF